MIDLGTFASQYWPATEPLFNCAKGIILFASLTIVIRDLHGSWTDMGFQKIAKVAFNKYGFPSTKTADSRRKLNHLLLLAMLAVFSLIIVVPLHLAGLITHSDDGSHLHLSEIVTGNAAFLPITHRGSTIQTLDCWLGALMLAKNPMVDTMRNIRTIYWAQQQYFGLLTWCLHLGYEAPLSDTSSTLNTLAHVGLAHSSLSLSQCLFFSKTILFPRQIGNLGSIRESSKLRDFSIDAIALYAMIAVIRTHRADVGPNVMRTSLLQIMPFLMTLVASSRTKWLLPTSTHVKAKTIGLPAEKSEKSKHLQTLSWVAVMTHIYGIYASIPELHPSRNAMHNPHESADLRGKTFYNTYFINVPQNLGELVANPSRTAMILDCLLTMATLCVLISFHHIRYLTVWHAIISPEEVRKVVQSETPETVPQRRSSRARSATRKASASSAEPSKAAGRSTSRQRPSTLSRSQEREDAMSTGDKTSRNRSASRSRTRSASRGRLDPSATQDDLRSRKGRRNASPHVSHQQYTRANEEQKTRANQSDIDTFRDVLAMFTAMCLWALTGIGTVTAAILRALSL